MTVLSETNVQIRMSRDLKEEATQLFESMGMSLSEAVRTFLTQAIAEQGMPFRAHIPNERTLEAMRETENGGGTCYQTPEEFFKDMGI